MAFITDLFADASTRISLTAILPTIFLAYWIIWIVYTCTRHPLAGVPGPIWASISRTWLMYYMYRGDLEVVHRTLHEKYGPLVRIAPDEVLSSDPEAIPIIYSTQRPLEKSDWYLVWRPVGIGAQPDLFTNINEKQHAAYKKIVGAVYAMSSILKNEQSLDDCVALFLERLGGFADREESFDFGLWLEMYAYDVIGAVFFGKKFGFLEHSYDHGNYIQATHRALPMLSVVGMAPISMRMPLLVIASLVPKLLKGVIAVDNIRKTAIRETELATVRAQEDTVKQHDLVSQLLAIVQEKGEKVNFTEKEVVSEMWTGIMAGADSTSISLRAIFYYMMKNPEVLRKATTEVDNAFACGVLSHPVQYNQAVTLPYISAVIKEAMRIFPSFQVPIQRLAPTQGLTLSGHFIPQGYRVGMNPGVVQFSKDVFGEDSFDFRPERWFESDDRNRKMDRTMINFGAGTRTCTGKNLAMTEIYKSVPEILRRFTVQMAHDQPWITQNGTFVLQYNVICKLKRREVV